MSPASDASWQAYSTALRQLLQREKLRDAFRQDVDGSTSADLNITSEMRTDLKNLLILLSAESDAQAGNGVGAVSDAGDGDAFERRGLAAQDYFENTYSYLRRAALATTVMSIVIFMMGLFLLGVAARQSLTGDQAATAVALAATGIGAIAAAFYKSPVTQMRESAAAVQRSTMVLMSYMLGLSLLARRLNGEDTAEASEMLNDLTRNLADLLPGGVSKAPDRPSTAFRREST